MFIKSKQIPTSHCSFKKKKKQRNIKVNQKEGGSEQIKGSIASQGLRLS